MKNELLLRAYIVAGALALVAFLLIGQTFRISVTEGDKWRAMEDSLYVRSVEVEAPRGNILASNGNFLATSQPFFKIHLDTRAEGLTDEVFEEGVDSLALLISRHINQQKTADSTASWLRAARARKDRYLLITKEVGYPTYQQMTKWPIFRKGRNSGGFIAERSEKRRLPFGMMGQRTIGYQKKDRAIGLEGKYDDILRGEAGRRMMQRLPQGHLLPLSDLSDAAPEPGNDIQTTLDVSIQDVVHQELSSAISRHQAEYGVAIVMETKTGAIRAMSSLTRASNGYISEQYNHAVGTSVEPGSTFKLASLLALLDEEKITPEDTIRVFGGKYRFYDNDMVDASKHHQDTVTVQRAFEISSNVGVARLVYKHFGNDLKGRRQYVSKLRQFRLDKTTGIDVDGEKSPLIKDPGSDTLNNWSGITLPWMSMGYETMLTPLQMLCFYNAVANDGRYMKPMLVDNIQREGKIIEKFSPITLDNSIASKTALRAAKQMLLGVVENGTARYQRSKDYAFAGKTGTVQYNYSTSAKARGQSGHQASFIGYFPADAPKYTVMVLISRPRTGHYSGSDVALPVWRAISDKIFAGDASLRKPLYANDSPQWYPDMLPRRGAGRYEDFAAVFASLDVPVFARSRKGMVRLEHPGDSLVIRPHETAAGKVPDVRGMGARDAVYMLESAGLRVDIRGSGRVISQSITPGSRAAGQYVRLRLE